MRDLPFADGKVHRDRLVLRGLELDYYGLEAGSHFAGQLVEMVVRQIEFAQQGGVGAGLGDFRMNHRRPQPLGGVEQRGELEMGCCAGIANVRALTSPAGTPTTQQGGTSEALWMGVPVVTLMGDRHVSRVSGSLLTAIGRTEWIASNADDYVRIAAQHASDPVALATARSGLREQVSKSSLGDHAGQSARFAAALRQCWRNYCAAGSQNRAA